MLGWMNNWQYAGNPVLDRNMSDFRDPHVFWSAAGGRWVMAVALPNEHKVLFYGSADLKRWEPLSEFGPAGATGGQWECPTLTEVPVAGADARRTRWVLKVGLNPGGLQGGSGEQYFTGSFDGVRFVNDNPASTTLWTDYGKDCYCALPFNNLPRAEPPVMLGWMNNWQYAGKLPTAPWRGQMTVPRRLQLRDGPAGLRLFEQPVEVLQTLRQNRYSWTGTSVAALNSAMRAHPAREASFELHAKLPVMPNAETGWRLVGSNGIVATVSYDPQKQQLVIDRTHPGATEFSPAFPAVVAAPLRRTSGPLELTVQVDRSSLEVFAQGGEVAMTMLFYPSAGPIREEFVAPAGRIAIERWDLRSAWTSAPK